MDSNKTSTNELSETLEPRDEIFGPMNREEFIAEEDTTMDEEIGQIEGRTVAEDVGDPVAAVGPIPSSRGRQIKIRPLKYGFIVSVGCHDFAIEKPADLGAKLIEYYTDPSATEAKWFRGELFS